MRSTGCGNSTSASHFFLNSHIRADCRMHLFPIKKWKVLTDMELLFNLVSRQFWVIGLAITSLNTLLLWWRSQSYIRQDPSLLPGYVLLARGYWICLSIPWLVMGFGIVWGGVPSIWHFLAPRLGNPYVLTWWVSWWVIVTVLTYWFLRGEGAELLVSHPGFFRGTPSSPRLVKLLWLIFLASQTAITIFFFADSSPLPLELLAQ